MLLETSLRGINTLLELGTSSSDSVMSSVGTLEQRLILFPMVSILFFALLPYAWPGDRVTGGGGAFLFGTMLFLSLLWSARGASIRLFVAS